MISKKIAFLAIILLISLVLFEIRVNALKEPFYSNPGCYPQSVIKPPLFDVYNIKENLQLSNLGSEDIYKNDSIYNTSNLEVNNIRYWKTPNNGKCMPANFCNSIYGLNKHTPQVKELKIQPWNPPTKRVNYFISS